MPMRKVPLAVRFLPEIDIFALKCRFAGHQVNYLRYPKVISGLFGWQTPQFLEDIFGSFWKLAIKVFPLSSSPF